MPRTKLTKPKTEPKIKKRTVKSGLTVDVYDIHGRVVNQRELPKEIFGDKVNEKLLAQSVRVYEINQRQGTVSTKTRGEVAGSTRKIYKQKGTGRARHGSIKAPIFVGGGVTFGPKSKEYSLKISKRMRKKALFSALSDKLREKKLTILDSDKNFKPKTKGMLKILEKLGFWQKNKLSFPTLLLTQKSEQNLILASRNIKNLTLMPVSLLNSYTVLKNGQLIFTKEALEEGLKLWGKISP